MLRRSIALLSLFLASVATAGPTPPSTPPAPTLSAACAGSLATVSISWTASTPGQFAIQGYKVERWTGHIFAPLVFVTAPATSATDTNRPAGTYYYAILARDVHGNESSLGPYSQITVPSCVATTTTATTTSTTDTGATTTTTAVSTTTTTVPTAPSRPTGFIAVATSATAIGFSWNASTGGSGGVAGYNLYRWDGMVFAFLKFVAAPTTTTTDTGLTCGMAQYYTIASVAMGGPISAQTSWVSATPPCPATTTTTTLTTTTTTGTGPTTTTNASTTTTTAASTTTTTQGIKLIGFVPHLGTAADLAVDPVTHHAYVSNAEFGLTAVDVTTPSSPTILGASNAPFRGGTGIAFSGSLAVVCPVDTSGMNVVDLSTPSTPKTVGTLILPAGSGYRDVAMAGSFAYPIQVVPGNPGRVQMAVVNLATPSAPMIAGQVTLPSGGNAIQVIGSTAYTANGLGLQLVDLTTPSAPALAGFLSLGSPARGVAVVGTNAYVVTDAGLRVVDVSNTSNPVLVASPAIGGSLIAASGDTAYLFSGVQLLIVDITTPATPTILSQLTFSGGATGIAIDGTTVFLSNTTGLNVVDASNRAHPVTVATLSNGLAIEPDGIAVASTIAAGAYGSSGLKVLDVSTPTVPTQVGFLAGTFRAVTRTGSFIHAVELIPGNPGTFRLDAIDVSTPSTPTITNHVALTNGGNGLFAAGTVVYVATGPGLETYDITTPGTPTFLGRVALPSSSSALTVAGNYAYVVGGSATQIVNVTDPTSMTIDGTIAGSQSAVTAVSGKLYALGGTTFAIYSLTSPTSPALLGSKNYIFGPTGVAVNGSLAVLVSPYGGPSRGEAIAVDVSNPAAIKTLNTVFPPSQTRDVVTLGGLFYADDPAASVVVLQPVP